MMLAQVSWVLFEKHPEYLKDPVYWIMVVLGVVFISPMIYILMEVKYAGENKSLSAEKNELKTRCDVLKDERDELKNKVTIYAGKKEALSAEINKLKTCCEQLQNDNNKLNNEHEEIKKLMDTITNSANFKANNIQNDTQRGKYMASPVKIRRPRIK